MGEIIGSKNFESEKRHRSNSTAVKFDRLYDRLLVAIKTDKISAFMASPRLISVKQTNLKTPKSQGSRKVTIKDDRKCANPVGNVCFLF